MGILSGMLVVLAAKLLTGKKLSWTGKTNTKLNENLTKTNDQTPQPSKNWLEYIKTQCHHIKSWIAKTLGKK